MEGEETKPDIILEKNPLETEKSLHKALTMQDGGNVLTGYYVEYV